MSAVASSRRLQVPSPHYCAQTPVTKSTPNGGRDLRKVGMMAIAESSSRATVCDNVCFERLGRICAGSPAVNHSILDLGSRYFVTVDFSAVFGFS